MCRFLVSSKRTIRYDVMDKYAAWIKQRNIKGILVNGTTGEGVFHRSEERKKSFEEWNKACRKCMVHIGGTSVADCVLCLADLFFKPTCEEDLVNYLKKVAERCPTCPIFYYHFPSYTNFIQNQFSFQKLRTFTSFLFLTNFLIITV